MMPGMDGYALAERIAADPGLAGTLIVMLTSDGQTGELARCQALGIAAWLTKPVRQSELFDVLLKPPAPGDGRERPRRRRGRRARPGAGRPARSRILLAEDHVVNQKVVDAHAGERGPRRTVVGDGRQALEALARAAFDLILMDVQMPEMDGFEAVAAIRRDERAHGRHGCRSSP